jgi:hypothetical protein
VEINVEQFDVDASGVAALKVWWRILSGNGGLIDSGRFSETRKGPSPKMDPDGAAASMSALVADFSGMIAQAIKQRKN